MAMMSPTEPVSFEVVFPGNLGYNQDGGL